LRFYIFLAALPQILNKQAPTVLSKVMTEAPLAHVAAGTREELLLSQVPELRADKDALRCQVAFLQQECVTAVNLQEHTALLWRVELLAQRLEDKNAEETRMLEQNDALNADITRLRTDQQAEVARLTSPNGTVIAAEDAEITRLQRELTDVRLLLSQRVAERAALEAREMENGKALVAEGEKTVAAKELPLWQRPCCASAQGSSAGASLHGPHPQRHAVPARRRALRRR